MRLLEKRIVFAGQPVLLRCDGRCDKAFGISGRPRRQLSDDPDDYVFLADDAVGTAPPPGKTNDLSEGGEMKPSAVPLTDPARMNKWCARACERSEFNDAPPDMAHPKPNIPRPDTAPPTPHPTEPGTPASATPTTPKEE